jgi:glucosyl-3-phosphoglycerate phosphatase
MKLIALLFLLSLSSQMGLKMSFTLSPSSSALSDDCDKFVSSQTMEGGRHINILLIRHGRSLGNDMMDEPGNQWGDPQFRDDENLIDSNLSSRGVQQAQALGQSLSQQDFDKLELIIVSPLTRALQTMTLAMLPRLPKHVPIIVHPLSTERVYTASDTGRPVAQLKSEFQDSRINFDFIPEDENWWFHTETAGPEWRPCDAQQWYAVPGEPEDVFEARLEKFEDWLSTRPEQNICLVSHWAVLRHLTGGSDFENCEAQWITWQRKHKLNVRSDEHW